MARVQLPEPVLDGVSVPVAKAFAAALKKQGTVASMKRTATVHGSPAEEVEKAWKRVGRLAVGARGVVVLDAAEVGKEKGRNRKAVALAAGTYQVWGHRPQGFGGDYSAAKLIRDGKPAPRKR